MKQVIVLISTFIFLFFPGLLKAQGQFVSNSTVTYDVSSEGNTTVSHDITLENTTSSFYATNYTLSLSGIKPLNPRAFEGKQSLPIDVSEKDGDTSLKVSFVTAVVGQHNKREFAIIFEDKSLVTKTGEIWEITTPKLARDNSFDFYSTIVKVPNAFGQLAYISPVPTFRNQENNKQVFSFDKDASLKSSITAAFGQFQVFAFNLTYHLENPLNQASLVDVAIPPDTNYQRMNYTQIVPTPEKVTIDSDGNWLATFNLLARQKIDVQATGAVQIFAESSGLGKTDPKSVVANLAGSDLWQTTDPDIKKLALQLKTPRAIYDYVVNNLVYDYARVAPNVERLGAVKALKSPKNAICTEFTDVFIALSRAAGIPAREVQGFAYTENPQIQPLSLVADVLHAWPEYWDDKRQSFIPIDPTWGSTSGIDYFSKLDLRHFTFVIHGADPRKPYPAGSYKLGPNPQKDVNVSFGNLPQKRSSNLQIENKILSQIPFADEIVYVKVKNFGPLAVYNQTLKVLFDNILKTEQQINVIPPFGDYETTIAVPYTFLGQHTPNKVSLVINDTKKSEFTTYKLFVTVSNLLMICLFIFLIVFLVYLKFRDMKQSLTYDDKTKKST